MNRYKTYEVPTCWYTNVCIADEGPVDADTDTGGHAGRYQAHCVQEAGVCQDNAHFTTVHAVFL